MGKRGPKPTPTAILKARGSWRAKAREHEPQPGRGVPRMPPWMMPEAKRIWQRLAPQLAAMGVLTTVDGDALTRYCQSLARWRRAQVILGRKGDTYSTKTDAGHQVIKPRPEVAIAGKLDGVLAKLEGQFGLTPSARAGLDITAIFTPGRKTPPPPAPTPPDKPAGGASPNVIQAGKDRFFKGPA